MKLKGKTALITGASRGIGKAIALELANQGVSCLLLLARNAQALADLAAEIEELNVQAIPLAVDLTKVEALSTTISQAWRDYGPIHLLVNCAGIAHQAPFLQSKLKNVQEEINVNLMGLYTVTRLVARRMASQQDGVIVNVSSLMGKLAAPTMSTYSATKFAILGFTQALRGELASHNVRVLALLPSLTDTDMVRQMQLFRWVVPSTSKQVAEALVKGVLSESPEIFVDWQSRIAAIAHRIVPWLMEKVIQTAAPVYEPSR
ncbi:SDR family NAD(P)-dependent oxidoreductase [Tumidithrix elongata RA019]|uniref:SDR family NAD(P)-dependent oxidoreductase n=1 Tax=Tumidithrix elongata BACA0141 TaxID=2716417 RepID=A0AAW9PYT7_9CYAN|nr:SDR family NAD(P)-dependent oxidoreductase [Tumidithrix elongata RA019]